MKTNNTKTVNKNPTTALSFLSSSLWNIAVLLLLKIAFNDYEHHNSRATGFSLRAATTIADTTATTTTTTRLPSNPVIRLRLSSEVIDSSSKILSSSSSSLKLKSKLKSKLKLIPKSTKKAVANDDDSDSDNDTRKKAATTSVTTTATTIPVPPSIAIHKFVKPIRVNSDADPTAAPIVYVYDHCPFCVRVRLALGLKNIKHTLVFLANDDVVTPTSMVGKKVSPILKIPAATTAATLKVTTTSDDEEEIHNDDDEIEEEDDNDDDEEFIMMESMDIIEFLENNERFGPTNLIRPASGRTDLKKWQKSVQMLLRTLQRPRYVATGLLPEFQQLDSRHAFIANHPLPPYDKEEWKSMSDISEKISIYADAMANDPTSMVEELNAKLVALDDIVYCDMYCTEGGISLDDIDLWARLRSVSIIQDVIWPDKLRRYMDYISELADISLYDGLAM